MGRRTHTALIPLADKLLRRAMSDNPAVITVNDPDDPRIAAFMDVRERDLTGRQGGFMIESAFVLDIALKQDRIGVDAVLISAHKAGKLANQISMALARGADVYVAEQEVMDAITGFHIHRGVLAFGRKPQATGLDDAVAAMSDADGPLLVAADISNHDNVGAIFRNAAAFGASGVLLDARCCDPFYRKAIRVSAGHVLTTPFRHGDDINAILDALERRGVTPIALSPSGAADIRSFSAPHPRALVLGAEGPGLPASVLARCETVRIPMAAGVDSLNVATAAAVALSHMMQPGGFTPAGDAHYTGRSGLAARSSNARRSRP